MEYGIQEKGMLELGMEFASMVFDFPYMVILFFSCYYLFGYSPWKSKFIDKAKWTLVVAIILAIIALIFKYFTIGICNKEFFQYGFRLIVSFTATTSFYENIAKYLIGLFKQQQPNMENTDENQNASNP